MFSKFFYYSFASNKQINIKIMTNSKTLIFTAGLPASGKSSTLRNSKFKNCPVVDCDEFKKLHKDYEPKNPNLVHDWSTKEARKYQLKLLKGNNSFVVDGTGTNLEKYIGWFQEARSNGFKVVVLYTRVRTNTSIERNAKRKRSVSNSLILEKALLINSCMEVLGALSDEFIIVDND